MTELSVDLRPQPRAGAARRARQRPAPVRGARPLRGRRRRDGAARGARLRRSGMQALDRYVAAALRQISMLNGRLDSHGLTRMMNYDPERLVSPIHKPKRRHRRPDDAGLQGAGAQADGRLRPQGARGLRAQHRALRRHAGDVVPAALRRHHPARPDGRAPRSSGRPACAWATRAALLLLSIRSGAAISMPGLMTTFVNVGLNDELAEALARQPRASPGRPGTATAASCSRGPCPTASTATSSTPS